MNNELTNAQATELVDEVSGIIVTSTNEAATLRARLLQVAAALKAANPAFTASYPKSEGSVAGSGFFPHAFQTELAKRMTELKVQYERAKSSATKNINDKPCISLTG